MRHESLMVLRSCRRGRLDLQPAWPVPNLAFAKDSSVRGSSRLVLFPDEGLYPYMLSAAEALGCNPRNDRQG